MSQSTVGQVIQRAISDGAFRRQLQRDPVTTLAGLDLTADERTAITSGDPTRLTALGVDQRMSKAFSLGAFGDVSRAVVGDAAAGPGPAALIDEGAASSTGALVGDDAAATPSLFSDDAAGATSVIPGDPTTGATEASDTSGDLNTLDAGYVDPGAAQFAGAQVTIDDQPSEVSAFEPGAGTGGPDASLATGMDDISGEAPGLDAGPTFDGQVDVQE